MVLIYIFLKTNEMEHFLCLLLLGYPLLGKPFQILSLLFYWFVFVLFIKNSLYGMNISPLLVYILSPLYLAFSHT